MSIKSKITKVDLADKYRVLMTEVLPYELPLWFSNELFYEKIRRDENYIKKVHENSKLLNFIPLDYKIRRTGGGTRTLSIMHPQVQKDFCDFYQKHQELIIYYCTKSHKSLRHPVKVVDSFYKESLYEKGIEVQGIEESDKTYINFISFFKYENFSFLYKFFESYDYNKLEKRFQFFLQVDVNKCFHSIYTHSISWAIKTKFIAKRDRQKSSFDQEFDKLMQRSNYSETNGILIGAEISRIFAEIIFQDIDLKIIANLAIKGIKIGVDYDFRRYVDDYFVYFNDPNIREKIIAAINAELLYYKMSLNDAKTSLSEQRPFITNITLCKQELSETAKEIFLVRYNIDASNNKNLVHVSIPGKKANELISKIKAVVKRHTVDYSSICNYLIFIFARNISNVLASFETKTYDSREIEAHMTWLLIDIDILYFIHAMDPRIVNTDKLTRIILKILTVIKTTKNGFSSNCIDLIVKKIFDSSIEAIKIFKAHSDVSKGYSVEIMNILLLLTEISDRHKLEESFLETSFELKNTGSNPTYSDESFYFLWGSLMLYIQDDKQYESLASLLTKETRKFFRENPHRFESAEFFMFWCDFMACPFIKEATKKEVIKECKISETDNAIDEYLSQNFPDYTGLIINWPNKDWLSNNIQKRVFKYAYE